MAKPFFGLSATKLIIPAKLIIHKLWKDAKRNWDLFRQSRLGLAGLAIIIAFVSMAVFAPLLAPYPVDYLAPDEDVFRIAIYNLGYDLGDDYLPTIVGPTVTPFANLEGGLWFILARSGGTISMTLGQSSTGNQTPFERAAEDGNATLTFRIQDLGLSEPLSQVLYIAPGQSLKPPSYQSAEFGDLRLNGLLALVANTTFAVVDPFQPRILYQLDLGFRPRWLMQDPISAGDTYMELNQRVRRVGAFLIPFGPFRYLVAADDRRVHGFEVEYTHNENENRMKFKDLFNATANVSGSPLPYYSIRDPANNSGIYVPVQEGLAVWNLNGTFRRTVPLSLAGVAAQVSAPLGYSRTDIPARVLVPVRTAARAGVLFLNPLGDNVTAEFSIVEPGAQVVTRPDAAANGFVHFAVSHPTGPLAADIIRLTANGTQDSTFLGGMAEDPVDLYFVAETSRVVVLGESGVVYSATTIRGTQTRRGVLPFREPQGTVTQIGYVGTFAGTKFGALSAGEVHGFDFDVELGRLSIYQYTGTTVAPLPPGTYASGNHYLFGTDNLGHDVLTLLIYGSRVALIVGLLSAFFAVAVGTLVGLVAGYFGRLTDSVLMRTADIVLVLPVLPFVLILTSISGPNIYIIVLILAVLAWPGIARVIRAQTLSLRERPFVDAARVAGASHFRIMIRHIAPNVLPFTFLYMTLLVAGAILTEAALSFLGLGDPNPQTPSWGIMLSTIQTSGSLFAWWWLLPPGLAITLISLGFYLLGRAGDEIINPRLRRR